MDESVSKQQVYPTLIDELSKVVIIYFAFIIRTVLTLLSDEDEEVYLPNFNHTKLPREGRIAAARNLALKVEPFTLSEAILSMKLRQQCNDKCSSYFIDVIRFTAIS